MLTHEKKFLSQELSRYINKTSHEIEKDIMGSFSGERPLVKSKEANTSSLLRTHTVETFVSGLISVMGGKWTTFRAMAEEAVDIAVVAYGLPVSYNCRTMDIKLIGSQIIIPEFKIHLIQTYQIKESHAEYLIKEYGKRAEDVLKIGRNDSLIPDHPFTVGEVIYSTRNEYAMNPVDILARRMRLAIIDINSAIKALDQVVDIMAAELNWDIDRRQKEYETAILQLTQFFS